MANAWRLQGGGLYARQCLGLAYVALERWAPAAEAYGKSGNKWIGIPVATTGGLMNYRISSMEKAGFKEFPKDTAAFLELVKALKKNNTPAGFALGHASGDANTWLHWALWAHGGNLVDKSDKVVINSPETAKALEYVKALYENFIPGTASWNDSSNNKIFVSGDLHLTSNGISIYVTASKENKAVADDMQHAAMPIEPPMSSRRIARAAARLTCAPRRERGRKALCARRHTAR